MDNTYYRKGFGLKQEIIGTLTHDYHSQLVERIRNDGGSWTVGDLTFRLAKEFGFCYGVDRAVEYAYEARKQFPDKDIVLVGEIIHNPHVNGKLESMGISILRPRDDGRFSFSEITPEHVVILPAFGVTLHDFQHLRGVGCVLVDTTCGSVLNVWKRVAQYARDGFTAIVHGKHLHEETKATASQVAKYDDGKYLVVRDMAEADILCRYIESADNLDAMEATFRHKVSDGLNFSRDLVRVGIANQTTMLASESLAIASRIGESLLRRYGGGSLTDHFRSFDTICSATQERQDAVLELINEPLDVMLVIGGYNSSNTNHLAKLCTKRHKTYHIADAACIDPDSGVIRHKPVDHTDEVTAERWLDGSAKIIGVTAGASTPNNKIGEAIERVVRSRGLTVSL